MAILVVGEKELQYEKEEELLGGYVGYAISSKECKDLCAIKFKTGSFFWEGEFPYDEIFYVIDGPIKLKSEGKSYVAHSGDIVFISKGSKIIYEVETTSNVFSVTTRPPFDTLWGKK